MGILSRLESEKRASPENPSTDLANPDAWLTDTLALGKQSRSGARINETTALYNTALSACVRLLAETVATLPLHVYRTDGRSRVVESEHPAARVLRLPNPEMDAVQFRETIMGHVLTWGNAYAEIERDRAGRPVRLWPLLPDRTKPQRTDRGTLYYTTSIGTKTFTLPAEDVFHLAGLGFDGIVGYSPVRMHREAVGLALATEEFGASWFGSGSRPSGVLTHPSVLSKEAKDNLRTSWEAMHTGLGNANRVAVLEQGLTWTQIGIPPEDAQFLETRKFQVEEIARIYRVPLHLIQHMEKSTSWGTGIEELGQGFVTYSLQSWLVRWEQRIQTRLIPTADQGRIYAKHSVEGLLRGDSTKRAEFYAKMWGIGAYSINDILELEDRNPVDDGDARFVPLNFQPLDRAMAAPEPQADPFRSEQPAEEVRVLDLGQEDRSIARRSGRRETFRPLFRSAGERVVRWETARLKAVLKRGRAANNVQLVGDFVGEEAEATENYVRKQFSPVVGAFATDIWGQLTEENRNTEPKKSEFDEFVEAYLFGLSTRYSNRTVSQIRAIIANAPNLDVAFEEIEELIAQWEETRSESFADNELVQSSGAFARSAYAAIGVMVLRWRANAGACDLCESLNGVITEISKPFVSAGSTVDAGGAPLVVSHNIGHPPLHNGCSCEIVPG